MRFVEAVYDLALAVLVGSIIGVSVATIALFDRAPSREFAGQVGSAVFDMLGMIALILSLVALASRFLMRRREPSSVPGAIMTGLAVVMVAVAAAIALWITPAMNAIWAEAPHAQDGSGLIGPERAQFMWLHGLSSAAYLGLVLIGAALIVARSPGRSAP